MDFNGFSIDRRNLLSEMKIFATKKGSSFGIKPIIPSLLPSNMNEEATPMIEFASNSIDYHSFYSDLKKMKENFAKKLTQIRSKISSKIKITFDSKIQNDEDIENALGTLYQLIKSFESKIKEHQMNVSYKIKHGSCLDRLDKSILLSLNTDFSKMVKQLKKEEQKYFSAINKKKGKSDVSFFDFIHENHLNEDKKVVYNENGDKMVLTEIRENLSSSQLNNMLDQINSLTDMLAQINEMAIEQGTIVDRIDMNLEMTLERTMKGNKELLTVKDEMEKGCAARLLKFLIVANVVIFLLLILKFK